MKPSPEIITKLRQLSVFERLDDNQAISVVNHMESKQYAPEEILFNEGDEGDSLFYIVSGFLQVLKTNDSEKEQVLANIGPGQALGEMAIMDHYPRSATVIAKTHVETLTLSANNFNLLVEAMPKIGVEILKGIALKLSMNLRYIDFLTVQNE